MERISNVQQKPNTKLEAQASLTLSQALGRHEIGRFFSGIQIGLILGLSSMMGYGLVSYYQNTQQTATRLEAELESLKLTQEEEALKTKIVVDALSLDFFITLVKPSPAAWLGHRVRLVQKPEENFRRLLDILAKLPSEGVESTVIVAKARALAWVELAYLVQNLPGKRDQLQSVLRSELLTALKRMSESANTSRSPAQTQNSTSVLALHTMLVQVSETPEVAAKHTFDAIQLASSLNLKSALQENFIAKSGLELAQATLLLRQFDPGVRF